MSARAYRLLFVGAPGVGKGTYSTRVASILNCVAISSGNLLRGEVFKGTEIGKKVKHSIEKGVLVPDELITGLVVSHFKKVYTPSSFKGYILDGFPRNMAQATLTWESRQIPIDYTINLTQPTSIIMKRLASRRICQNCGFVYNIARIDEGGIRMDPLMPTVAGVCDKCSCTKPFLLRKDDEPLVVETRFRDYEKLSKPMLEFYREKGVLHEFAVLGGVKEYLPKMLQLINALYSDK